MLRVFVPFLLSLSLLLLGGPAPCQNAGAAVPPLAAQEGVLDTSPPEESPKRLNGGVSHTEKSGAALSGQGGRIVIGPGGVSIDGNVTGTKDGAALDGDQLKKILQGLQDKGNLPFNFNFNTMQNSPSGLTFGNRRPHLSGDAIRKLEHGVIGIDARVRPESIYPVIIGLYPTCPAAEAGILPGDQLVKADDHVFKLGDGQAVLWKSVGGRAGTPVDITVLRNGQELTFHLIRMNIEDIKDDRIRQNYEFIISAFGPPGGEADK
ncbi:MAG: PDZ domain-containing protein [Cyanobacteria bacterium REEB67]|nr:PDZ domain-containing protein [Cyanobacteria bacterium REEB67]